MHDGMIVSINQPAYLPWLGYFERIARSDVHVVLDDVQFEKNSFVNRNRVLGSGGPVWLTVPVETSGRFGELSIHQLAIADDRWRKKHWATMKQSYAKAAHFREHAAFFESVYGRAWPRLGELIGEINGYLVGALGIAAKVVSSREVGHVGAKDELVLDLCRRLGATTYLSGALGRSYLREERFAAAGIEVVYQDYRPARYAQGRVDGADGAGGAEFVPALAAVDAVFRLGAAGAREVMLAGGMT
jgi:hypothetical protein